MSKSLDERLADIADEAEAGEEDQTVRPIPAHVKITRGNPRNKVLQVRLNPDEYAAIERIAERRGLPASTIAREVLLKLVDDEDAEDQPLVALVALADRIKAAAVDAAYASGDPSQPTADHMRRFREYYEQSPERLREYGEHLMSRLVEESGDRLREMREQMDKQVDNAFHEATLRINEAMSRLVADMQHGLSLAEAGRARPHGQRVGAEGNRPG
jgi:hypothetical protein